MKNWAIVTGASSGIGRAFAIKFAELGYNLVLISRNKFELDKIKVELTSKFMVEVDVSALDLTNEDNYNKITEITKDKNIEYLINNAGFGLSSEFYKQDANVLKDMIKLNCLAPTVITKLIIDKMILQKKGNIVFLGSILAFMPTPFSAVYSATKSFNEVLGSALWYELKKYNINVLAINPGSTKTNFHDTAGLKLNGIYRNPEDVVKTTFKYLGKKPTVLDGFYNKLIVVLNRIVSRKILINLAGMIFKNLLKNK